MTITVIISVLFHFLILLLLMFLNVFIKVDTNRLRPPASSIEVNIVNMDKVKPAQRRVVEKKEVVAKVEKKPPVVKEKQEKKTVEPVQKLEVKSKQPEKQQTAKKTPVVKEKPVVPEIPKAVEIPAVVKPEPVVQQKEASPPPVREVAEKEAEAAAPVISKEKTVDVQVAKLVTETPVISGPEVDIPDFKYDYYLNLIRSKVDSKWSQPITYANIKQTLIEFTVNRDGEIGKATIAESSGDSYFDQSALRAVSLSNPLPPLPRGYKEGFLKVRYRFIFGDRG